MNDNIIREDQLQKRDDKRVQMQKENVSIGDTVRVKNRAHKHQADDIYLVTNKKEDNISVKKFFIH